jgi:hypothetical protein
MFCVRGSTVVNELIYEELISHDVSKFIRLKLRNYANNMNCRYYYYWYNVSHI